MSSRRRNGWPLAAAAAAAVILGADAARALINPRFTPNDLVEQSEQVLAVRLAKPDAQNRIKMEVVRVLKGKQPEGPLVLDLAASGQKEWAAEVGKLAERRGQEPVPLFIGKYKETGQGENVEPVEAGLLQIDRLWVAADRGKDGAWSMSRVDDVKQGTWDGGSDMLIKAVEHLLKYPDDRVPVDVGCDWAGAKSPGKVAGEVAAAEAVDLDGQGRFVLYVASSAGDRLFGWDAAKKDFADLTGARKLAAKSLCSAWADFNGDGRLDLASWDGTTLRIIAAQEADGSLAGAPVDAVKVPGGGCLSLAALDVGAGKRAGLLVGTAKAPLVVRPDGDGYKAEALAAAADLFGPLGQASPCLLADLDADGWPDVLQPFEKGSLVYKGKGPGAFEAAVKLELGSDKGRARAAAGDYDMDGLLDVFMVGPGCCGLWSNRGGLKFAQAFGHSGEMCYTAQPGAVVAQTCDINNDGLQDVFLAIADEHPHLYFNRGFRSFGKALSLIWGNVEFTRETGQGQQAGTMADLNGDGAQDLAVVLKDGKVLIYLRGVIEGEANRPLSAQVLLRAASGTAGPVTVTGWSDRRCLGTWSVAAGSTGAFFGLAAPGEVKLKWRLPGGKLQEKTVEVEKRPKTVFLEVP